ncbi:hypothetical protein PILCRDRAFT_820076 [Piloderma croceum F 1598]|uniref:Uncharacterized protein n=1 Tax=Piloderma croceum (strain F 1598) TaxID=765440 RepID=A0A0C3FEE4_PILCF|nr:hypothetical protein PILCRDRAFT_820076 [Piloderma croceum F 1598]
MDPNPITSNLLSTSPAKEEEATEVLGRLLKGKVKLDRKDMQAISIGSLDACDVPLGNELRVGAKAREIVEFWICKFGN